MAGYMKLGDIKGESVDKAHKEWINLLSVNQSLTRPMAAGISGSTRQRASVTCGDLCDCSACADLNPCSYV